MTQFKHHICGVHITERLEHALQVQQVLTEFGRNIKTRLGLHQGDFVLVSSHRHIKQLLIVLDNYLLIWYGGTRGCFIEIVRSVHVEPIGSRCSTHLSY